MQKKRQSDKAMVKMLNSKRVPALDQRRSAPRAATRLLRGPGGRLRERLRRAIFRGEPLCRQCFAEGRTTLASEIDHIIPLEAGGSNDRGNLQPLCPECHKLKTGAEQSQRMKALNAKTTNR